MESKGAISSTLPGIKLATNDTHAPFMRDTACHDEHRELISVFSSELKVMGVYCYLAAKKQEIFSAISGKWLYKTEKDLIF